MVGLNTKYIPSKYFQEYLVDKDTGLPLAGGIVTFYKDQARTQLKPMYQLSGSPPNYTYTSIGSTLTLSSVGTFQDGSGNDIVPYFYPYDENGNTELYYITVYSALGVFQFSREGEPNVGSSATDTSDVESYIANGQFLVHNDILEEGVVTGKITTDITNIAQGGWTFERSTGSTAIDFITFPRFGSAVTNPTATPRYACRMYCQTASVGDLFKAVRLKYKDVNKFTSPADQVYTLSFSAVSNLTGSGSLSIYLIKYYGSGIGPTPEERIHIKDLSISTSYTTYNVPITFPNNDGKIIGDNDDDYLQISFEYSTSTSSDISITDVVLAKGNLEINQYPVEPEFEVVYKSLAGFLPVPAYDGSDLELPLLLSSSGLKYDRGHIGRKYDLAIPFSPSIHTNMLHANGATYDTFAKSTNGIPYKRLRDYLQLTNTPSINYWGQPRYGTGSDYCTATGPADSSGDHLYLTINVLNSVAPNAADGSIPTTFTFTNSTVYTNFKSTEIGCVAASSITGGSYFHFSDNASRKYIVWYKKDGVGTKPATAAYKYIEVDIEGTDTAQMIRNKTCTTINYQYFAVPDWRGAFFRMVDSDRGFDPDRNSRHPSVDFSSQYFGVSGDNVGSVQYGELHSHTHAYYKPVVSTLASSQTGGTLVNAIVADTVVYTGGNETRPVNYYVDCAIGF